MKPTLIDVAEKANVHISTVSRALRGDKLISPATVRKVKQAARKLGYHPNVLARRLAKNKANTIEIVVSHMTSLAAPILVQNIIGVSKVIEREGYDLYMATSRGKVRDWSTILTSLKQRKVDGVLVFIGSRDFENPPPDDVFDEILPIVFVNNLIVHKNTCSVNFDNFQGGYLATKRLVELGHKNIAFIGPKNDKETEERYRGYCEALKESGIEIFPDLFEHCIYEQTGNSGALALRRLLSKGIKFSAVFCSSDWAAIGAMEEIERNGMKVPDDISVIGFDDMPIASHLKPSLTSIRQNGVEAGKIAADMLMKLIQGQTIPQEQRNIVLPVELIERESVKKIDD